MMTVKHPNSVSPCWLFTSLLLFTRFWFVMEDIDIASLNVNGARDSRKRAHLYEMMRQKRVDILFMQETHSDDKNCCWLDTGMAGLSCLSHHSSTSGGVAMLFTRNFTPISYSLEQIVFGRLLKVRAQFEKQAFVVICVYDTQWGNNHRRKP